MRLFRIPLVSVPVGYPAGGSLAMARTFDPAGSISRAGASREWAETAYGLREPSE